MGGFSTNNFKGFVLALLSSGFIGASFIIKKKGLRRAAAVSGVRAGVGGYAYLLEPLWWLGMITMIVGEVANFVAYAFAPAVLVTPLGALSIIVSAVLAHFILKERLHKLGILGCVMCISGSVIIVIHAPQERAISSVQEIWNMATQTAFLLYVGSVVVVVFILIFHFAPQCGSTNVLVFTGICSLMGSLTVMSVKALGTSLKLTFEGKNQLIFPETWFFMVVVAICVITQMNYLNKALDTFNTAVVSPIYYVMFTSLTILASVIMFKDWDGQSGGSIISEICGFIVVLSGTILLNVTKDYEDSSFRESWEAIKTRSVGYFVAPESWRDFIIYNSHVQRLGWQLMLTLQGAYLYNVYGHREVGDWEVESVPQWPRDLDFSEEGRALPCQQCLYH